jgi:cholesterol transport system auxiliary component
MTAFQNTGDDLMQCLTRRMALFGGMSALAGCSAVSALNSAATPLDTYDLAARPGNRSGRRTSRTLLVARPQATAAVASDRILVKPDAVAITYLPNARWTDELPLVVQSLLIRSISGTGRVGYVGQSEGGPVPDSALLARIDTFQVSVPSPGVFEVAVDIALTVIRDRDQSVVSSRSFAGSASAALDTPAAIVAAFQEVLDTLLPQMADWAVQNS